MFQQEGYALKTNQTNIWKQPSLLLKSVAEISGLIQDQYLPQQSLDSQT